MLAFRTLKNEEREGEESWGIKKRNSSKAQNILSKG
jgi:hypothetical protein